MNQYHDETQLTLAEFDELLSHVNAEENEFALEIRAKLVALIERAEHPFKGGL